LGTDKIVAASYFRTHGEGWIAVDFMPAREIVGDQEVHTARMDGVYRRQRHVYDPLRKLFLFGRDRLLARLDVPPGGRVLEIGCGTARNLIVLHRRRPDLGLHGLDASTAMLATAAAKLRRRGLGDAVHLRHGLAEEVTPATFGLAESFDAVFFSYSLTMIGDGRAALDAALASLKPGGILAIVDFWDQADWPRWLRQALQGWLARFHVRFRAETLEHLERLVDAGRGALSFEPILGRYAFLAAHSTYEDRSPTKA
jgi:S-adenosylmethionine-diacylgycerolhomoserine-N-methlytransferase